jgi:hypothetical protein
LFIFKNCNEAQEPNRFCSQSRRCDTAALLGRFLNKIFKFLFSGEVSENQNFNMQITSHDKNLLSSKWQSFSLKIRTQAPKDDNYGFDCKKIKVMNI